jgi:hypothetical protein
MPIQAPAGYLFRLQKWYLHRVCENIRVRVNDAESWPLVRFQLKPISLELFGRFSFSSFVHWINQLRAMGKIEISTAEDVDNCGREFSKFSRTLRNGDFDLEECEDMLLDAVDYGLALVRYCHGLQSKHASKRPRER